MNNHDTVIYNHLVMYPAEYKNKLNVLDNILLSSTSSYRWKEGKLIRYGHDDEVKIPKSYAYTNVSKVVRERIEAIKSWNFSEIDKTYDETTEIEDVEKNENLAIEMIEHVEDRMNDMSIPTKNKYPIMSDFYIKLRKKHPAIFYIDKYSLISNLPDNIENEWLTECSQYYNFMCGHPERYIFRDNLKKEINDRIKELYKIKTH